ncbi:hypothetical protein [Phenylobacterium sp.]|uniref:hypothetical protein n=1 Tax=Phenylobacterium sp. TaxID=1871053 RepID=UPI0035B29194
MSVLLFALALFAAADPEAAAPAEAPPAEAAAPDAPAAEAPAADDAPAPPVYPVGAPHDDYGLVAWCYGALGGYLDLHDQVMPEVTRIETTWRRPGSNLADDLKVYSDMQKEGRANLKLFAGAIQAAEKASLKPISARGQQAVKQGRSTWTAAATMPKARVAQEWMSWTLPEICMTTATRLKTEATLMGATFDPTEAVDAAPETPPEAAPDAAAAPTPEAAPEAPPAESPADDGALSIDRLLAPSTNAATNSDQAGEAAPAN